MSTTAPGRADAPQFDSRLQDAETRERLKLGASRPGRFAEWKGFLFVAALVVLAVGGFATADSHVSVVVPTNKVGPYTFVRATDVKTKDVSSDSAAGKLKTTDQLVGKFTTAALSADQPVASGSVINVERCALPGPTDTKAAAKKPTPIDGQVVALRMRARVPKGVQLGTVVDVYSAVGDGGDTPVGRGVILATSEVKATDRRQGDAVAVADVFVESSEVEPVAGASTGFVSLVGVGSPC
jgi:hypothetical protein